MTDLTEKTIGELLDLKFFIPSYQRGYRWTDRQIEDLLDDINSFVPTPIDKSERKTWYCLQPVVVKECGAETKCKNNLDGIWYEVIDGQQRLTSIYLILHYANEMWIGKQKIPEFKLKYETRHKSFDFLRNLQIDELEKVNYDNVDFFHISNAYNTIHKWVTNNKSLDNNCFLSKLKFHSKVIWYEVTAEKDSIEIFTRINMGKISLTDAELIKALFLNSSNFPNTNTEELRLRQLEIASEWDKIEYTLQNDELWFFINNSENDLPTRIEFIFNIMKKIEGGHNTSAEDSTFRFFSDKFSAKNNDDIDKNWKEIKRIFQTIEEWFTDRVLYHKIGYLIAVKEDLSSLLKDVKDKHKHEFRNLLDFKIAAKVQTEILKDLVYGDDNSKILNILLLHNVHASLAVNDESSRFSFSKFKNKKNGWSIEHIHAQNSKAITEFDDFMAWYSAIDDTLISAEIKNEVNRLITKEDKSNDIVRLTEEITQLFGDLDINTIDNLALLSKADNSALNNSVFPVKREKIIALEKSGSFIPICTRKIFQKYFDGCTKHLSKWEDADRNAYLNDIIRTVYSDKK